MSLLSRRSVRLPLAVLLAAYVSATILVGWVTAYAVQRGGAIALGLFSASPKTADVRGAERRQARLSAGTMRADAAMTPLNDTWAAGPRPPKVRLAAGPQFGGSSRNPWSSPRPWGFGGDDDDDLPGVGGTFRTVCVRLCDGYYFPVSFSVTAERLQRDSKVCESRCGAQGRLFIYRNPGGTVEDMQDLSGRPYRQLRTAFLYRSEYVPSCTCQAHPWETASLERHRAYRLARDAMKGNRDALKELQALRARQRQEAVANPAATPNGPPVDASTATAALPRADAEGIMRLGGSDNPKARPEPAPQRARRSDPDWVRRAFSPGSGW